ncbi:MAG: hypothetical protein JW801_14590 [Bacteroidales bacterium]|nr:hypothetical protein [Bacteroidales bacterium]
MKIFRNSFFILFSFVILMTACEKETQREQIDMMAKDSYVIFDKSVLIFEDPEYLISTPLGYFIDELGNSYAYDYADYLSILDEVLLDADTRDSLNAADYFSEKKMTYILAHFLESGKCHILEKQHGKTVETIEMEIWGGSSAPLSGAGGRRFYIEGELFLETLDWIS